MKKKISIFLVLMLSISLISCKPQTVKEQEDSSDSEVMQDSDYVTDFDSTSTCTLSPEEYYHSFQLYASSVGLTTDSYSDEYTPCFVVHTSTGENSLITTLVDSNNLITHISISNASAINPDDFINISKAAVFSLDIGINWNDLDSVLDFSSLPSSNLNARTQEISGISFFLNSSNFLIDLSKGNYRNDSGQIDPTEDAVSETQEPSYTQYEAGMYKVGTDIPAGTYLIIGDVGYVEVSSDSSGQLESIVSNDNYVNRTYLSVTDGQYFKFDGVAIPEAEAPAYASENGAYPEGKYLVGKDIPAGEYKISLTEENVMGYGYIEVSSDASGTLNAIITNANIQGDTYQTVQDGQYLKLNGAEIKGE